MLDLLLESLFGNVAVFMLVTGILSMLMYGIFCMSEEGKNCSDKRRALSVCMIVGVLLMYIGEKETISRLYKIQTGNQKIIYVLAENNSCLYCRDSAGEIFLVKINKETLK